MSVAAPSAPRAPLTADQRNSFVAAFLGWTMDAFDYFLVVLVYAEIAKDFGVSLERMAFLTTVTLINPVSPYGFGGSHGVDGRPCTPDWAGTGGGTAAPDFVRRLAERDAGSDEPLSSPREVLMTFFGPGPNRPNVDEDFLVAELFTTTVGDDHYPGDMTASEHWPNVAPGSRGVLNSMSGTYYDTSAFGDVSDAPPITWLRGTADQVISERSMFDLATLGELGAVPGWPGADTMPRQSVNTERGSRVALKKRRNTADWAALIRTKILCPALSLRHLARDRDMCHDSAAKRWKRYEAAREAGSSEEEAIASA